MRHDISRRAAAHASSYRRARAGARALPIAALTAAVFVSPSAIAAPPLITEDGGSADQSELEVELWIEGVRGPGEHFGLAAVEAAFGVTDRLELAAATGVGVDDDSNLTVPNPYGHIKLELFRGEEGQPTVGAMGFIVAPAGTGVAYGEEVAAAAVVPVTLEFAGGAVATHANLGISSTLTGDREARAFWGVAAEADIPSTQASSFLEATAGDPMDPAGPRLGAQGGLYWGLGDGFGVDLALGAMTDPGNGDELEWIGRLGVSVATHVGSERDD